MRKRCTNPSTTPLGTGGGGCGGGGGSGGGDNGNGAEGEGGAGAAKGTADSSSATAPGTSEEARAQLTGHRSWWSKWVQTVHAQIPAGAVVGKEDDKTVQQHIIHPLEDPLRLLCKWDAATEIPPGLHYHATPSGQALAKGEKLEPKHLTSLHGRERTLSGEVPILIVDFEALNRTDMKAGWLLQECGGHSDVESKRCPLCNDEKCMKPGKAHESLYAVLPVFPQETVRAAANRHHMWVWDLLRLNLDVLRKESVITPFQTLESGDEDILAAAHLKLNQHARLQAWWPQVQQHIKDKTLPAVDLQQRIEQDMGDLVLDTRPLGQHACYYSASKRRPDLTNPDWRNSMEECEFDSTAAATDPIELTPAVKALMGLLVVGTVRAPRINKVLRKRGQSLADVQRCCLHMVLCIIKGLIATIWRDVNSMSSDPQDEQGQHTVVQVLQNLNNLSSHHGLHWYGWHKPNPDSRNEMISGKPAPSGRTATWCLQHLIAIVDCAYPPTFVELREHRQRMLELAKHVQEVLGDLTRIDWSPIPGMCWERVPSEELVQEKDVVIDQNLIHELQQTQPDADTGWRRLRRDTVVAMTGPTCRLTPASCVRIGQEVWRVLIVPDLEELMRRANLPKSIRGLIMAWILANDRLGKGSSYGGYYFHDLAHHIIQLLLHAEALGLGGLGILSNSVLEHFHQEYGKPAFKGAWVACQASFQKLGRMYAAQHENAVPGDKLWNASNPGFQILQHQLSKSMCSKLCRGCFRVHTLCPGLPFCKGSRADIAPKNAWEGWAKKQQTTDPTPQLDSGAARVHTVHLGARNKLALDTTLMDAQIDKVAIAEHKERLSEYKHSAQLKWLAHRAKERAQSRRVWGCWGTPRRSAGEAVSACSAEAKSDAPLSCAGEAESACHAEANTHGPSLNIESSEPPTRPKKASKKASCECPCCLPPSGTAATEGGATSDESRLPCCRPNTCGREMCAGMRPCKHRVEEVFKTLRDGCDLVTSDLLQTRDQFSKPAAAGDAGMISARIQKWVFAINIKEKNHLLWMKAIVSSCDPNFLLPKHKDLAPIVLADAYKLSMQGKSKQHLNTKTKALLNRVLASAVPLNEDIASA